MSSHRAHEHDEQHVYDHPEDSAGLALPAGAAPARRVGLRRMLWIAPLAALVLAAAACGEPDFEAGPLGAVRVAPGEAIQIRSMQVLTGLGDLGTPSQRGVALALADYGPIKGHDVSMGAGLDSLCTAEGGAAAANEVAGEPQVVGVIGPSCSVAAAAASPILSEAGLVMIAPFHHLPIADLGSARQRRRQLSRGLLPNRQQRPAPGARGGAVHVHGARPAQDGRYPRRRPLHHRTHRRIYGRVRGAWRLGHGRLGQQGRHGHVPLSSARSRPAARTACSSHSSRKKAPPSSGRSSRPPDLRASL